MAIKTKAETIMNQGFAMAFQKLNQTQLNPYAAFKIKKIADTVEKTLKELRRDFDGLQKTMGKLDEKGELVRSDAPWGFELAPAFTEEDYQKAYKVFVTQPVVFETLEPLTAFNLDGVKISAAELSTLAEFVDATELESPGVPSNVAHLPRR